MALPAQEETKMSAHHTVLFYVTDPQASARFYEKALGLQTLELSPGFGVLKLNDATMLGLWNRKGVLPKPDAAAGAGEIGLHLGEKAAVDRQHKAWVEAGITILQPPQQMDFGYTCTAADPDGHRIRVFAPDM
jgi:predicted enzyme related to lactoylglutathione lyase